MSSQTSPLETLAAFFIVFATGVVSLYGLNRYTDKVRREARDAIGPSS